MPSPSAITGNPMTSSKVRQSTSCARIPTFSEGSMSEGDRVFTSRAASRKKARRVNLRGSVRATSRNFAFRKKRTASESAMDAPSRSIPERMP